MRQRRAVLWAAACERGSGGEGSSLLVGAGGNRLRFVAAPRERRVGQSAGAGAHRPGRLLLLELQGKLLLREELLLSLLF